jgi:hypothetical protein
VTGAVRGWLATALLLVLVLGACSSSDVPTDPRQRYIAALTTVFTRPDPGIGRSVGRCAATAMVDLVTSPALTSAGVTTDQLGDAPNLKSLGVALPADAVDQLGDAFVDCDLGAAMVAPFLRSMAKEAGAELGDDAVDCVQDHVSTDAVARGLAVTYVGGTQSSPAFDAVLAAAKQCPAVATALGLEAS